MEQSAVTYLAGLDSRDLPRALACATAISRVGDHAGFLDAFRVLTPDIQFQKIHVCPESNEQRFIMAHAEDAVFVGFQGTTKLQDYACDMMIRMIGGKNLGFYHKGIRGRSGSFLGLTGNRMLTSLIKLKKRVIFCGHSLGGAVAHMVLMRMLLENVNEVPVALEPHDLLSIAFGAPHLCDKIAATLINDNPDFKGRFVTFVNGRDPIPRLLHHLPRTIEAVVLGAKTFVNAESWLVRLIDLAGTVLDYLSTGKVYKDNISSVSTDRVSCESWEEVKENAREVANGGTEYVPFGSYVFLNLESPFREEDSTSEDVNILLRDVQLDVECLAEHTCMSYLRALVGVSLIPKPQGQDQTGHTLKAFTAVSSRPEVLEASGQVVEYGEVGNYLLEIKGKNLLLLRKVSWNGVEIEANEIVESTDEGMVIMHAFSAKERDAHKKRRALTTVKVETSFGTCESEVLEGLLPEDEGAKFGTLLKKLVLVVRLWAKLAIFPTEEDLKCLDVIMRCSPMFESIRRTPHELKDTRYLSEKANAAAEEIDQPWKYSNIVLTPFYSLVYEFKPGCLAESIDFNQAARVTVIFGVKAGAVVGAGGAIVGGAVGMEFDLGWETAAVVSMVLSTSTVVLGAGVGGIVWVVGAGGWVIFKGIDQVTLVTRSFFWKALLQPDNKNQIGLAVAELHLWNKEARELRTENGRKYTEDDLVEQVNGANDEFTAMLKSAISTVPTEKLSGQLKLKTSYLEFLTDERIREFLRKIHAIVETKKLYERIVVPNCFVAVVGPEDVGKTSFIKTQVPDDVKVAEVGIDVHTEKVTPYKLENGTVLVDFPGTTGVTGDFKQWWSEFKVLPNIIVLLLNFDHDIKTNQIATYEDVKKSLGCRILVVFNKVDNQVNSRTLPTYMEPSYFPNLKKDSAARLNCSPDHVFYAALSPLEEKEKVMTALKKVGVLDVKAFMEKLGTLSRENYSNSF